MGKIIIHNNSTQTDLAALELVMYVIRQGRRSNTSKGPQYCFIVKNREGLECSARLNKSSDVFYINDSSE